jgi:hypothetical protein
MASRAGPKSGATCSSVRSSTPPASVTAPPTSIARRFKPTTTPRALLTKPVAISKSPTSGKNKLVSSSFVSESVPQAETVGRISWRLNSLAVQTLRSRIDVYSGKSSSSRGGMGTTDCRAAESVIKCLADRLLLRLDLDLLHLIIFPERCLRLAVVGKLYATGITGFEE